MKLSKENFIRILNYENLISRVHHDRTLSILMGLASVMLLPWIYFFLFTYHFGIALYFILVQLIFFGMSLKEIWDITKDTIKLKRLHEIITWEMKD